MTKNPNDASLSAEIHMMFSKLSRRNIFEALEANQPRDLRKVWSKRHPADDDRNTRSMKAASSR